MPRDMRMPTVMKSGHAFSRVPSVSIERSVFDRSHGHKTTFDAGFLIPVFVDEVLPGDTFHLNMTAFCRLTTPIRPLMDNLYLDSFFFFVPYRILWTNFVKFMGEQTNPGDSIVYSIPVIAVPNTPAIHSLADYMGVMTQATATAIQTPNAISALPFRAYYRIYNDWFRDENLINSSTGAPLGDGPDSIGAVCLKRGKRHDYFTSCLPNLQKGTAQAAAVSPIGTQPPIFQNLAGTVKGPIQPAASTDPTNVQWNPTVGTPTAGTDMYWSSVAGETGLTVLINDLRLAFQTQKFLERDMRGGTRYTEIVRSHFGVVSPDARLQRPEYLGGGSTPVVISSVAQTNQPTSATNKDALGYTGAYGTAVATRHGFHKSFTEHGVILGIVNVRADLTYSQGIERMWWRQTRFDFYWPEFAHIGEQSVLSREIWLDGTTAQNANDISVFGYQERYAEYRYKPSRISGIFRPNAATSLESWHLSQKFTARPTLNQAFIEDDTETVLDTRVAVPAEPDFYADFWFDLKCARPMPVFGVPGFIDHF